MNIHEDLRINGSFPKKERELCYQDYYLDGTWNKGEREIVNRAELLDIQVKPGELVAEIGCNIGGFMQYCALKGAKCIGFDNDADYIRLAKNLASLNNHDIAYVKNNTLNECVQMLKKHKVDHLLLLSMGKHIGENAMFNIIDELKPTYVYLETNAFKQNEKKLPYYDNVMKRNGHMIGKSYDRHERVLYKIQFNKNI